MNTFSGSLSFLPIAPRQAFQEKKSLKSIKKQRLEKKGLEINLEKLLRTFKWFKTVISIETKKETVFYHSIVKLCE